MSSSQYIHSQELSPSFFITVFSDDFLFGRSPTAVLKESNLSSAEKALAQEIRSSNLYQSQNYEKCAHLCEQLSSLYAWQSNSEGPLIFAGAILYLLRLKNENVHWFIRNVTEARKAATHKATKISKKLRATVIVPTSEGILLAQDRKGLLLLPGGAPAKDELPIAAAIREVYEETGLIAQGIEFLFEFESEHYQHHVFLLSRYTGNPTPCSDAIALHKLEIGELMQGISLQNISHSAKQILLKYQQISENSNQ